MTFVPVIDVSRHQGRIDFRVMRSRGVRGLILRAAHAQRMDDRVLEYARDAQRAGFAANEIGLYTFVNPSRADARAHAETLLLARRTAGLEESLVMFDVERYDDPGNVGSLPVLRGAQFADWLLYLVFGLVGPRVAPAAGVMYTGAPFWNTWVGSPAFGALDVILARYPVYPPARLLVKGMEADLAEWIDRSPKPLPPDEWATWPPIQGKEPPLPVGWDRWDGWQFSAGFNRQGPVYGCESIDVDLNVIRDDAWARWTHVPATPTPVPLPGPVHTTAAVAATGGEMPLRIVADKSNTAAPERWVTNGLVRFVGDEHWIDWLTRTGQVVVGQTIRDPEFLDPRELAGIPLVDKV